MIALEVKVNCFVGIKKSLKSDKEAWIQIFKSNDPENHVPDHILSKAYLGMGESWIKTLVKARLMLVVRPDKFKELVRTVFSLILEVNLLSAFSYDRYKTFINDLSREPILIIAAPGMDIEGRMSNWNSGKERIDY